MVTTDCTFYTYSQTRQASDLIFVSMVRACVCMAKHGNRDELVAIIVVEPGPGCGRSTDVDRHVIVSVCLRQSSNPRGLFIYLFVFAPGGFCCCCFRFLFFFFIFKIQDLLNVLSVLLEQEGRVRHKYTLHAHAQISLKRMLISKRGRLSAEKIMLQKYFEVNPNLKTDQGSALCAVLSFIAI